MATVPFNLFDLLLMAVLVGGAVHGRRRGLSQECLRLCKWLVLVLACAAFYGPAGALIARSGAFSMLACYLIAYLGCALLVLLLFSILERRMASRLEGSDIFGRTEYFLGMGSGLVRFGCILLAGLALLNARAFTPADLKANQQYQEDAYGSTFFPTLHSLQVSVFERSLAGPWIKQDLCFLLIRPTPLD